MQVTRRCEARTVKGTRCRREATVCYHTRDGERLICREHERAARTGQLRLPARG